MNITFSTYRSCTLSSGFSNLESLLVIPGITRPLMRPFVRVGLTRSRCQKFYCYPQSPVCLNGRVQSVSTASPVSNTCEIAQFVNNNIRAKFNHEYVNIVRAITSIFLYL